MAQEMNNEEILRQKFIVDDLSNLLRPSWRFECEAFKKYGVRARDCLVNPRALELCARPPHTCSAPNTEKHRDTLSTLRHELEKYQRISEETVFRSVLVWVVFEEEKGSVLVCKNCRQLLQWLHIIKWKRPKPAKVSADEVELTEEATTKSVNGDLDEEVDLELISTVDDEIPEDLIERRAIYHNIYDEESLTRTERESEMLYTHLVHLFGKHIRLLALACGNIQETPIIEEIDALGIREKS